MRVCFLSHLLTVLCVFVSQMAYAQNAVPQETRRTITITGEAEVRVVPDQVIISMTAEGRGQSLVATQRKNDEVIGSFIEFLSKKMDIEEKYIQTDFTNVQPSYRQCNYRDEQEGRCSPLEITYYAVRRGLQIKLNKVEDYEKLISKALEIGITRIDNVQFITTKLREHRDTARDMAAKAAEEKGDALSKTLGMQLGKPITINANQYHSFYQLGRSGHGQARMMMQNSVQNIGGAEASGSGPTLALGQINITAQVHVVFEIE